MELHKRPLIMSLKGKKSEPAACPFAPILCPKNEPEDTTTLYLLPVNQSMSCPVLFSSHHSHLYPESRSLFPYDPFPGPAASPSRLLFIQIGRHVRTKKFIISATQ